MANQEHLDLLQQGTADWNNWRTQHQQIRPDLMRANLMRANLMRANLIGANFTRAYLDGADLSSADLSSADLIQAYLSSANLSSADLSFANLRGADLSSANLIGANLIGANLIQADLSSADLSFANLRGANIGWTIFGAVDLRSAKGLETVKHIGPSTIGTNTLERSQGDIPEAFLRGAGLSDTFIEYVRSLVSRPIEYYTCFISYSSQDEAFARRLYADLQREGVRCWFAPYSLRPGDVILKRIDEAIHLYDKLVLLLSLHSVESRWVELEVSAAQTKEVHQGGQMLFPLRLDETVMKTTTAWARTLREQRHIADFSGWKDHDSYQQAFTRLLQDLQASTTGQAP